MYTHTIHRDSRYATLRYATPPLPPKVTEAQQQWWKFKAANFDSVLLFKVGKFYEVRGCLRF